VDGGLNINLNAYSIHPNTFLAFKSIETLNLIQSNTIRPMSAMWDWKAFQGPKIQNFYVVNIAGVIPPHQAPGLMQIAGTLQMIEFENCRQPVRLGANDFSFFGNLKSFAIKDTPIRSIDDQAFNGMQSLTELYLINTSLNNFPTKAASQLTKLVSLNVKNSNIQYFTGDDFKPFQDLATLELSGNNLQAAVNSGALDNIPQSVFTVMLEDGNLDSVPASFTSKHPEVTLLSMANNGIRALKNGDFSNGNKLISLNLEGNPIATIEDDALQYLNNVQVLNLYGSALVSLDLSVFNGMNRVTVVLDGSYLLKGLQVSDVSKFPQVITIFVRNAVLLTLNSNIGTLLANPNFVLDISENKNIDCNQDISWMARYVLCVPFNMKVDNTQCTPQSGGSSLYRYLYTKVPNACDVPSTTTTSTSTTTRTSSSGSTTTSEPTTTSSQKTTTKSASSITASILATSMMVIFASVLKFF